MRLTLIALATLLAACTSASAPDPAPMPTAPIVLSGEITRADHQSYREIPFTVPPGTGRITIDFTYDKENRTVIDLGLRDPQGQRGWSGGNKTRFTVSASNATPSYRPGSIQPGEWKLVLGIPNIREGQTARYTATVRLERDPIDETNYIGRLPSTPSQLSTTAGWYRGDFHTHTAHSDGSCGVEGKREPCPTIETARAAYNAGLNFVAITDHNTISQLADIESLKRIFPQTLLIPGTEITTFNGHANAIGTTGFLDFQLGSPRLPTLAKLFDQVDAQGGFLSVNHPSLPSGEACMGCGWTVKDTDWSRVTAIEVLNGSAMRTGGPEGPFSGIRFWDNLLKQGHRVIAIGGSDNHDATDRKGEKQPPIGSPTTVVYAEELSTIGIVAGVKSGRVFIDVNGLPEAWLDMGGYAANQPRIDMGGTLVLGADDVANIIISRHAAPEGARVVVVSEGLSPSPLTSPGPSPLERVEAAQTTIRLNPGAAFGYIRPEVRDSNGKLLLIGNPIFVRAK